MSIGFGKFDSVEAIVAHAVMMNGFGDDYRAKLLEECSHGATHDESEHDELLDDASESNASCAGIVLIGDSQGFISAETFTTTESLEREWERLRKVESDIYRQGIAEEHSAWLKHGDRFGSHDSTDCEACEPVEGFAVGDTVNYSGIASRIVGFDSGSLIVVMVGDDARRIVDSANVTSVEDYCSECGAIDCYGDGRPSREG